MSKTPVEPPVARKAVQVRELHGERWEDPYAWLRDDDWQAVMRDPSRLDPEIRSYLEAENAYCEAVLARNGDLRDRLVAELRGRIKERDSSVPLPDGPYNYQFRFEEGGEYPIFCRARLSDGAESTTILDANAAAEGKPFFKIGSALHSPDHLRFAYSADEAGSEYYTIRVLDLATGAPLPDEIETTSGAIVWAADGRTLFYVRMDESHRPSRVYRHRLGADPKDDALVYEEPDAGFFVSVGKTESGRYITIDAHDHSTTEVRLIPADRPEDSPRLIAPRTRDLEYRVSHAAGVGAGRLIILTNADGAEDFKIAEAPLDRPGRAQWRDLVPHQPGRLIREILLFKGHLVRLERWNALPRLVVRSLSDGAEHEISFDEEVFDLGLVEGYEFDTTTLRFAYSSPTTPLQTFDYDLVKGTRALRKQQEIPSGHDPERYLARRLSALSHDGTEVPISLVHAKSTPLDGSAPLLLYGYGAYGLSMPASFSANRFSLIDRGFVYAIAHVRGGMECGYRWYRDGKLQAKPNTFRDFAAAAEHLIELGYTAPGRIVGHGGSAGGMLMGVMANEHPDLFRAIVAEVPFVDVLTTMSDSSLPLTPPEWPEWGNPLTDEAAFRLIRSYSPYDNVAAQDYPHLLITAGLTDPRVTYWEPAKWAAKLRATKTGSALLLLRTEMEAGHGGAAGRFAKLDEVAAVYAFVLQVAARPASADQS